jgi:hypothetical protein
LLKVKDDMKPNNLGGITLDTPDEIDALAAVLDQAHPPLASGELMQHYGENGELVFDRQTAGLYATKAREVLRDYPHAISAGQRFIVHNIIAENDSLGK